MGELSLRFPGAFAYALGDVRQRRELQQTTSKCQNHFSKVTILLNTAGVPDACKSLMETDESLWDLIYEMNVESMYHLTNIILPDMVRRKSGTIISMASIAGLVAGGGGIVYISAKHIIVGLTKQLALDYAERGIRVRGIAPEAIQTPMNAADSEGKGEMAERVANETPVERWV